MDQTLRKDWARAAMQFIATNPREYGDAPGQEAFEGFLDRKIGEKFHTVVTKANLTVPESRAKIDKLLDDAISEQRRDITPLRKNPTYKIAFGLKNTIGQMI